jgi:phosphatidylserine decarboxylase
METVYCGEVNPPPRPRKTARPITTGVGRTFAKGDELGRFNMGSTVVLLFQRDCVQWQSLMVPQATVRLGQTISRARS